MSSAVGSVLAVALMAAGCAVAEPPAAPPSEPPPVGDVGTPGFEMAPGVVVDPAAWTVYVARPGGGIEALEAATGRPLWSSAGAARPLLAVGGRLLAQRESGAGLPLAILDAANGRVTRTFAVPLPEGVRATVDESLRIRFRLAARAVGDDAVLEWEYLERDALGVSPPGGRPFARRELGATRVDLQSGAATSVDPAELPSEVAELPQPVAELVAAGRLRLPPARVADLLAAPQQLYEPTERLVLRRWRAETGESLPEVVLVDGRAVAALSAADRRHLLVVTRPAAKEAVKRYLWSVYSLATGERVAERPAELSATPFCLLGGGLVYLEPPSGRRTEGGWRDQPRRVRALDTGSGEELWQRPVRDPAFRGPMPPAS